MEIADSVSATWITLFDDQAKQFFGKSAQEMGELQTSDVSLFLLER